MTTPNVVPSPDLPHVVLSRQRRRLVTFGVMMGTFLAALEATVVGTAMPTVIASLGGLDRYSWVFSAYLLTATVTVPLWGRLSDLYGRRLLYLAGISLFLAGSALSGAALSINQLILFRAIQGLGAGALVPLSMTINGDIYTVAERARMQGLFSGIWGLSSILGPMVGGLITQYFSWRWVFYINIPFGLAAAIIVTWTLVEPPRERTHSINYAGAVLLTGSISALLVALNEMADPEKWTSTWVVAPLVAFVVFGVVFVWTEVHAPEPVVPFTIFRNRVVTSGSIISFLVGTAMFGALSFVPLFVQGALGGSAKDAGLIMTPFLLGWVTMSIVGGRLMLTIGYRVTVLAGLLLLALGFVILTTFDRGTPQWLLLFDMALMGAGMGLAMLTLLITMQNSVEREQLGTATSLNQFSRSIGGAIGVAVMGAVMTISLSAQAVEIERASGLPSAEVTRLVANPSELINPATRVQLERTEPEIIAPIQTALGHAIHYSFMVGAIFAGLALVAGLWLPSGTPVALPVVTADSQQAG